MSTAIRTIGVIIPMFRGGMTTAAVVDALERCRLPTGCVLKVIIVDDASDDDSVEKIEALSAPWLTLLRNHVNRGRSASRNRGAREIDADCLLFLDSDCVPVDDGFVIAHMNGLDSGAAMTMGAVRGANDGFWHSYQAAAFERRVRSSTAHGIALSGSSQNFMIDREVFLAAGGFDEGYDGYGFEDRDLFLRIEEAGHRLAWAKDAVVSHLDRLALVPICRKMAEAGGAPAVRFRARHPAAYRRLGYSSLDVRRRRWLRLIEPVTTLYVGRFAPLLSTRLESAWIPLRLRMAIVRSLVAASYLHGTASENTKSFLDV